MTLLQRSAYYSTFIGLAPALGANAQISTINSAVYTPRQYNDIPAAIAAMADQDPTTFLNNARDGAVKNVNGKVTSERPVTIDGHPGKEFIGDSTSPQEASFTARVYWVNPHLYQQLYIRPKTTSAASENGQKFLDSFKLTAGK